MRHHEIHERLVAYRDDPTVVDDELMAAVLDLLVPEPDQARQSVTELQLYLSRITLDVADRVREECLADGNPAHAVIRHLDGREDHCARCGRTRLGDRPQLLHSEEEYDS